DIRETNEYEVARLPQAVHLAPSAVDSIPLEALKKQTPADVTVIAYCTAGYRSGLAAVALEKRLGRAVLNLDGGIISWFNAGGRVETPKGETADRIHPFGDDWAKFVVPRAGPKKVQNP
ncbi:MAG: rhodanese-like domain-containing protein, partial [Planctomycetota bacterium]